MKIIGLTGGIGSGKSTVSAYLEKKGYPIVDADKIARQITEPGHPVLQQLVQLFGADILCHDGSLDRKKLASIVFTDRSMLEKLNDITHRQIKQIVDTQFAKLKASGYDGPAFLDAPLLFETDMDQKTDENWTVFADDAVRIRRVMERDRAERAEVLRRIENQMSQQEKMRRADVVIDNSGTQEALVKRLEELTKQYEC